ncbi:MAG: 30S ribosomal protein S20, partial [Candidatus Limnocylindrales bacterium]
MAHSPRGWTGARTPSAIKRVRTAERRRAINQPRRSAAKTFVSTALKVATGAQEGDTAQALADAMSALDKAAKVGAIHSNNAARRKSRLAIKLNALAAGTSVQASARAKTTGTAAAVKAARTRIATAK